VAHCDPRAQRTATRESSALHSPNTVDSLSENMSVSREQSRRCSHGAVDRARQHPQLRMLLPRWYNRDMWTMDQLAAPSDVAPVWFQPPRNRSICVLPVFMPAALLPGVHLRPRPVSALRSSPTSSTALRLSRSDTLELRAPASLLQLRPMRCLLCRSFAKVKPSAVYDVPRKP